MSSGSPALVLTMRCMSVKLSILRAVDRNDQVARLEAGGLRGAVRLHGIDARRRRLLAVEREHGREDRRSPG